VEPSLPSRLRRIAGAALFVLASSAAFKSAAEPGAEVILDSKTCQVRLYVTAVSANGASVDGAELAWLPRSSESDCAGQSIAHCRDLDPKPGAAKQPPHRTLTRWVTAREGAPAALLAAINDALRPDDRRALKAGAAQTSFDSIDIHRSIVADVRWTLWSNGENFDVLRPVPARKP
jgi:hypothetical protein